MLIVDDERRYVAANAPARELLGISPDAVPWHRVDDFTPEDEREALAEQWDAFLASGGLEGWLHLCRPTGDLLPVEFSVTANVMPGRHLSVVLPQADDVVEPPTEAQSGAWIRLVAPDDERQELTPREHDVMALVAAGLQGGDIATQLFVSPETVKSHVQNAMSKLGARTRAHAVAIALSSGQIDLQTPPGAESEERTADW
jgi:DNA-binding CsgD family transcriptional regulator